MPFLIGKVASERLSFIHRFRLRILVYIQNAVATGITGFVLSDHERSPPICIYNHVKDDQNTFKLNNLYKVTWIYFHNTNLIERGNIGMLSEIIGFLSSIAVDDKKAGSRFRVNLNKNRIRSISAYSSNSIFYFPMIVSDQCTPEEAAMAARMSERTNASFVVACISLMPFHRIKADDKASVEEYLKQFHQNMGFNSNIGDAAFQKVLGFADTLEESHTPEEIRATQDFLLECWEKSKRTQCDFVKIIAEEATLLEMFNEDPIDPRLRIIQEQFLAKQEELETWGFLGEATDDMFGLTAEDLVGIEDDDEDWDEDDDIDPDDYPDDAEDELIELLGEAALKAAKRNKLEDSQFGLPGQRKFPLHDKKHVRLAIQMFKHCPEKDRPELAKNIKSVMSKFGMDVKVGKDSAIAEYMDKSSISESSVGEAINSIKFSLEAVSENKILSCKNLTTLRSLESKLLKLKNRYVKYLNRYKKKWKENKKSGKKSKLVIRFNNVTVGDPKAFMKQFGEYIKIINKRLKLVEKRRAQLHSARGDVVMTKDWKEPKKVNETTDLGDIGQMEFAIIDRLVDSMDRQINAPDEQVFTLVDDEEEEVLTEANATPRTTNRERALKQGLKDASIAHERTKRELERSERQAGRYKTLLDKERKNYQDSERRAGQLEKDNERMQKQIEDQQKTRAQLRNERDKQDPDSRLTYSRGRPQSGINPYMAADANHTSFRTFDKEVFTDMDMKKANDAVPTFARATIGFVIDETEEVVSRDILVGIKSYIQKAPSMELITDVYNCIINKRKFLKFVKFTTGEERSLADLLFGIRELRSDAFDARSKAGQWRSAFKRRRRWAKMSIPYLMKEYTPNGTLVMTMNEVDFIKSEYGIDIMSSDHVRMIMDADFLLCLMILDQANEVVYVVYDGQGYQFQEYSYAMLERSESISSRELRELYRSFSK